MIVSAIEHLLPYSLNAYTNNSKSSICAIIRPRDEVPIYDVIEIAQAFDTPTFAYGGMKMRLVNSSYHPYATRMRLDANSTAYAIINYEV